MSVVLTLAWREMRAVFLSPLAYVVLTVYTLLGGLLYVNLVESFSVVCARALSQPHLDPQLVPFLNLNQFVIRTHLWLLCLILMFLAPLLTMRLLAEERRTGTAELVLTAPVRAWELVLGKYLAGVGFVAVACLLSAHYPLFLYTLGQPDTSPILVGYLGLFLAGSTFVAVGLFASSLTESPVVAAVLALGMLLALLLVGSWGAGAGPQLREVLSRLSFAYAFQQLAKGLLSASAVLYFLSVSFLGLFATLRVVESHRWR